MSLDALIELFNEDQRKGPMLPDVRRETRPGFVQLVALVDGAALAEGSGEAYRRYAARVRRYV